MNRIALPTEKLSSSHVEPGGSFSVESRALVRGPSVDGDATPLLTFVPMHYEAGYAYPLVVWLHGALANEQQLDDVMPKISMRNYVAAAPRGTCGDRLQRGAHSWRQTADDIEEAESRVFDCVATAQRRYNIHPERIFLVGVGCGGTMALRVAWNHPGEFAGVATFSGPLPVRNCPLRHVNTMRSLPCFVATGRHSCEYPELDVCRDLRLLHAAGCTVALRQYPCGDELTTDMLADLNRWLMELVCGAKA